MSHRGAGPAKGLILSAFQPAIGSDLRTEFSGQGLLFIV